MVLSRCLTTRTEPRRACDVNRECGTEAANRRLAPAQGAAMAMVADVLVKLVTRIAFASMAQARLA
jgi:hypothetical protein